MSGAETAGGGEHGDELILWLPPGRESRCVDLEGGSAGALRTHGGLLVRWHGTRSGGRRPAAGAAMRVFEPAPGGRTYVEVARDGRRSRRSSSIDARAAAHDGFAPGAVRLVAASGAVWTVPDPAGWPDLSSTIDWPAESRAREPAAADPQAPQAPPLERHPRARLRLAAAPGAAARDGVLFRLGEGRAIAEYLLARPPAELRTIRRGDVAGLAWIHAPHGLPPDAALPARPLRNLASAVEPVLVPADREPRPAISPLQLRALFGARDGDGVLWWDEGGREHRSIFTRSRTRALDADAIADLRW